MKGIYLALVLLALGTGGQAATGVGSACSTSDACTDTGSYCDTSVTASPKCQCNTGWFAKGTKCVRGAGRACHHSECFMGLLCMSGACLCDTATIGYAVGTNGTTSCSCPTGETIRASDSKCAKEIGQACTAASDCIDNAVCTSSVCACATGYTGATCATCATNYAAKSDSTCGKVIGETCTADAECIDNAVCTSSACACDAGRTGAAGATSCPCTTATHAAKSDGSCGLIIGETCAAAAECIDNAVCNSLACACDAGRTGATGATSCPCTTATHHTKSDGSCVKKIGQACSSASECIDGALCTSSLCSCPTGYDNTAGLTSCTTCASTHTTKADGTCGAKIGQSCSGASNCIDYAVCTNSLCACDASLFREGATGASSCTCTADYTEESSACVLRLAKDCNSTTASCMYAAICEKATSTCICDASRNYMAGSTDTSCVCDSNSQSFTFSDVTYCGKEIGQSCTLDTDADVCVSGATCKATTVSDVDLYSCQCSSGSSQDDGSCSGAENVAISVAMLIMALVTSALI